MRRTAVLPNRLFPDDISTCFIIKNTDEKKDDENCIEKTKELLKEQGITGDMFITLDQLKKEYKGELLYSSCGYLSAKKQANGQVVYF